MTRIGLLYVDQFQQKRSRRIGSLGLGYIAAYLQQQAPGCEVLIEIDADRLLAFEPDMVGVSTYSETLPTAVAQAQYLRSCREMPIILGGAHIASNPLDLPEAFDAGVVGEGEEAFLELLQACQGNAFTPQTLQTIPGLTFRSAGELKHTGRRPPITDMDQLAHPDRQQMLAPLFRSFSDYQPILHVHTARGCPYRCTFCSAPLVNPQLRFHSPQWVVAELEQIARQFPWCRELTISDDLFTIHKKRLTELVSAIREAGLHKRFFFFCSARSNTLTREICQLLRDMNVLVVAFGFESASDSLVRELKGVGVSEKDYQRVLDLSAEYGLYAHGNFILGAQHETRCDLLSTYRFIQRNADRFASVYFTHMTPFPGTRVWDQSVEAGLVDPATVDYRVLNLDFDPATSVFLNQHYDKDFYTQSYRRFKRLETFLNDRYYAEEGLIKDIVRQHRRQLPARIGAWASQLGLQRLLVVSEINSNLPPAFPGCELELISPWEWLATGAQQTPDAILLYYALDACRDPSALLQAAAGRPLLTLTYHIGNLYEWGLLLLGQWEEGIYGARQRHHQRFYTLQSLRRLMEGQGRGLQQVDKLTFTLDLDYSALERLKELGKPCDPDTFAYLALWN